MEGAFLVGQNVPECPTAALRKQYSTRRSATVVIVGDSRGLTLKEMSIISSEMLTASMPLQHRLDKGLLDPNNTAHRKKRVPGNNIYSVLQPTMLKPEDVPSRRRH